MLCDADHALNCSEIHRLLVRRGVDRSREGVRLAVPRLAESGIVLVTMTGKQPRTYSFSDRVLREWWSEVLDQVGNYCWEPRLRLVERRVAAKSRW